MNEILFQTSLIAAFAAGMVALFAPCCITFLLPAYLGSVFKEKEKIVLMTLVFGLGIFIVLLPAVLGVAFVSSVLFRYHDGIYLFGGFLMIIVSILTFLGIKLPMPVLPARFAESRRAGRPRLSGVGLKEKTDVLSVFTLGIFSGITSACCAPVLIGVLTLSFLSPSFFGALLIGGTYVLGMVVPLLLISVFLSGRIPKVTLLRKSIFEVSLFGRKFPIIMSNFIAAAVFFVAGIITLFLLFTGRLVMGSSAFTKVIQNAAGVIDQYIGANPLLNILFLGIVAYFIYWISKKL
ncbi:MAG: cytochrome c biogenesis protein CcdA [Candidatus Levybacteria bacterium]|nr:cytochrome c biogenesis protein CcdA [Candidatus Levybacteria bacterium]